MNIGWLVLILLGVILILLPLAIAGVSAAPWIPTRKIDLKRIVALAGIKAGDKVYDLGCGDARVLIAACQQVPDAEYLGIDLSWLQVWHAKLKVFRNGFSKKIKIKLGSLFVEDLTQADLVFVFLLPKPYAKISIKLKKELPPGARVISAVWPINELKDKLVKVSQPDINKNLAFYLYQF